MVVVALGIVVLTIASGLLAVASIWNSVRVQVIAGDVVIESGPVPWTRRRLIEGVTIEQLYVQQAPLERTFIPHLGGNFDVQARLRDGTWITVVRGCRSEDEAQRIEFFVERALKRDDEHGTVEDDERSEVFSEWRDAIGPAPGWVRMERDGDGLRITCRKPPMAIVGRAVALGIGLALGLYVFSHSRASGGPAAIWSVIVAILLAALVREILWRQVLVIGPLHVSTTTRGLFGVSQPVSIQRRMIESLDCRSRTILKRRGKFGSRRVRRYDVVAVNAEAGCLPLVHDLPDRGTALLVLRSLTDALDVPARPSHADT